MSRTLRVSVSRHVSFDVTAEDVCERACRQKADYTSGAFLVSAGVFKSKAAGHDEVAGKKECGSFIVKDDERSLVLGRGDDMDDPCAKVQMRRAFIPISKLTENTQT